MKKYKFGGRVPVEVEDEEVAETPNGQIIQFDGATHEDGGIDTTVPEGTEMFSSRLSIDGKTMAERKLAREKGIAKLNKLYKTRPVDKLVHNAIKRKTDINDLEERQDMFVQELAGQIYQQPKQKKAYGGGVWSQDNAYNEEEVSNNEILYPNTNGYIDNINNANFPTGEYSTAQLPISGAIPLETDSTATSQPSWQELAVGTIGEVGEAGGTTTPIKAPNTAGNLVGMAGTILGGIAPLINSKQAWKNRIQPTNPYLGFNKDALDTNQQVINNLTGIREAGIASNKQARTGAINRNSNSTRSLNTLRALNTGTDIAAGNVENQINLGFASQMSNVLGQRSALQTQRDSAIMGGNKMVQDQDRADVENYYTNKGRDLQNLGTQAQIVGKNMNQQKHNEDFLAILPMLSKYGLGISYVNGKPTLVNTK